MEDFMLVILQYSKYRRVRNDVVEALRELKIPNLRYLVDVLQILTIGEDGVGQRSKTFNI
ncbi:MAG: hypothetical protein R2771_07675 [Saprospiraceae bacterium]